MSLLSRRLIVAIAAPAVMCFASVTWAAVGYQLTPFGGSFSFAPRAINNHGTVVGVARHSTGAILEQPVIWKAGTGPVRVVTSHAYDYEVYDINDRGLICGSRAWFTTQSHVSATIYNTRTDTWLSTNASVAAVFYGLSNGPQPFFAGKYQSGYNQVQQYPYHAAYRYQRLSDTTYAENRLGSKRWGSAVNERGDMVGYQRTAGFDQGFLFTASGAQITLADLATNKITRAEDINLSGAIAGTAYNADNQPRAAMWSRHDTIMDLGALSPEVTDDSEGTAINHWGQVVGWSHARNQAGQRLQHAFVYRDGQMMDLNDLLIGSTATLTTAYDINDRGQILTNAGVLTPVHLHDGGFDDGGLGQWSPLTQGASSVNVIDDPANPGNPLAHLATGSPAAITQTIDTPGQPFAIVFDYEFLTDAGSITVALDGTDLFTINPPSPFTATRQTFTGLITDPAWFNLTDIPLTLTLDSATVPAEAYIDNVSFQLAIPEPASVCLVGLGALILSRRSSSQL
jgi:probable HAF family extracellular repeat protein